MSNRAKRDNLSLTLQKKGIDIIGISEANIWTLMTRQLLKLKDMTFFLTKCLVSLEDQDQQCM